MKKGDILILDDVSDIRFEGNKITESLKLVYIQTNSTMEGRESYNFLVLNGHFIGSTVNLSQKNFVKLKPVDDVIHDVEDLYD